MMTMDKANAKTGYVVVDKNWMEKGRRYMVGSVQQVVVEENIEYEGLQAWQRARNVIFFAQSKNHDFHVVEVRGWGIAPTDTLYDTMIVTDNMEVLREVPINELLMQANAGEHNYGAGNRGSRNVGDDNVGSYNNGDRNTGNVNFGNHNSGRENMGDDN
ncbi:pentapeptide repeat-containing protein [Lactiplantibacillus plantarum]|uniref:pentapeptide repeat-containing protein n=1 Tax=Lactiplantibacillus plantarum TaxID=1590 RepID=UPI0020011EDB|nr:pentapeptide repeat-containing protein [Lactiplantibacillus plantarum]